MSRLFYPRLAVNNLNKNGKTYIPYILTCICTIMMFYNMRFLAVTKDLGNLSDRRDLRQLLFLGSIVIAIFSVIFLFYTNSFLIKRRKKEFGLFNILGMEKKHVARIMFFETLIIGAVSLIAGVLAGILLSKLMVLMLCKVILSKVTFGFEIPVGAVATTIILFSGIFIINLVYNVFQVHLSKPIELLKAGNAGEKEPKTKWVLAVIGAVCLGTGYYISLTTESPLAALNIFFIAVVLVIIGTYCLFTAGSVAVLKMLRRNKGYYYKLNHFTMVSGMIYRMKQNAAGLANICILSTMVIVMLSTTISMYVGIEDVLRTRYPRNIVVSARNASDSQVKALDAAIDKQSAAAGVDIENVIRHRSMEFVTIQSGGDFTANHETAYEAKNLAIVGFITLDDYNKMENKSASLAKGEALLYTLKGDIDSETLNFDGFKLHINERLSSLNTEGKMSSMLLNSYYVIVDGMDTIKQVYSSLQGGKGDMGNLSYYYGFDVHGDRDVQMELTEALLTDVKGISGDSNVEGAESSREKFFSLYGGLFFIGVFLGVLFIMATVLIIYYKQIAEGYDDKERFEIMQKVGMSTFEVRRAIQSQVLAVFFLPLVTAVIHLAFAFKVITKLLLVLDLNNVPLFAFFTGVTIVSFAVFYVIVYMLTAKTYYKIVSQVRA